MSGEPQSSKPAGKDRHNRLEAGLAGAGGGTLFVMIAEALPANSTLKPILKYLAPSISVALSAFWIYIKKEYNSYYRGKKLDLVLMQLEIFMNDPEISAEHKEFLKQKRQQVQLDIISDKLNAVDNLGKI